MGSVWNEVISFLLLLSPIEQLEQLYSLTRRRLHPHRTYYTLASCQQMIKGVFVAYQGESAQARDCPDRAGALP